MNTAEIMELVHNESMEYFIPLKEIPTERERKQYEEAYASLHYYFPYSYESFQHAYPGFNPEHIYCNRGFSSLYYWDEAQNILLQVPVELEVAEGKERVASIVQKEMKACKESMAEGDYRFIHWSLNGRMKMEYLNHLLNQNKPIKEVYSLFHSTFVGADFGASLIKKENLLRVLAEMPPEEKEKLEEAKQQLPERIRIYRGEGQESIPYEKAYSWSLSPQVATFYATRLGEAGNRFLTAEANREDILCFGHEGEQEVLLLPEHVQVLEIDSLYDKNFLKDGIARYHPLFEVYREDFIGTGFEEHGMLHAMRTMLLSELIYEARHPKEKLQMNHLTLAMASIYHDSGRKTDGREFHSMASAENFLQSKYRKAVTSEEVEFLIFFHEAEHKELESHLKQLPEEKQENVRELFQILQDADALDRVRFGHQCEDSLDVNRLWLKESRQMTLVSQMLYDGLRKANLEQHTDHAQRNVELKM